MGCLSDLVWEMDALGNGLLTGPNFNFTHSKTFSPSRARGKQKTTRYTARDQHELRHIINSRKSELI